jgi:hypothetical protein
MPLFIDGVEIKNIFVDGVQMSSVFVDGVEVFSPGSEHTIGVEEYIGTLARNYGYGDDYPANGFSFGTLDPVIESINGRAIRGAVMAVSAFAPTDISFYLSIDGNTTSPVLLEYGTLTIDGVEEVFNLSTIVPVWAPDPDYTIYAFAIPELNALAPEWAVGLTPKILITGTPPPPPGVTHNVDQGILSDIVGYGNGLSGNAFGSIDELNFNGVAIVFIRFVPQGTNPLSFRVALAGGGLPQDFFYEVTFQGINGNEPLLASEATVSDPGAGYTEWSWSLGEQPPLWNGSPLQNVWGIMDADLAPKVESSAIIDIASANYRVNAMTSNGDTLVTVYRRFDGTLGGQIKTSIDGGTSWNITLTQGVDSFYDVWYGNGQFVAVGGSGQASSVGAIYTSPDGLTWTQRTVPNPANVYIRSVIWSEVGQIWLAACKRNNDGYVLSSPDGVTWTERRQGGGGITCTGWVSLTENVADGVILALGEYLSGKLQMSSSDGINWGAANTSVNNSLSVFFDEFNRIYWFMASQQRVLRSTSVINGLPSGIEDVTDLGWTGLGQTDTRMVKLNDDSMLLPGQEFVTTGRSVKADRVSRFSVQPGLSINAVHVSANGRVWACPSDSIRELTLA